MRQAYEAVRVAFRTHALTLQLPAQALEAWHTWATQQVHAFQRTSWPSKAVTACWRNSITTSEAYQSGGIRCGRCCITSIVAPQTGQRQPRDFSDERFQTSLKPCYRTSMLCHGPGNEIMLWR